MLMSMGIVDAIIAILSRCGCSCCVKVITTLLITVTVIVIGGR